MRSADRKDDQEKLRKLAGFLGFKDDISRQIMMAILYRNCLLYTSDAADE